MLAFPLPLPLRPGLGLCGFFAGGKSGLDDEGIAGPRRHHRCHCLASRQDLPRLLGKVRLGIQLQLFDHCCGPGCRVSAWIDIDSLL